MKVYLIARPTVDTYAMVKYLTSIGVDEYVPAHPDEAGEDLCEFMGRLCYNSFNTELNPNVTKIRTSNYLQNVIKQTHGSILEHAQYSFVFQDITRVCTHELCRHRVGTAISQQSLRYCRLTELNAPVPICIQANEEAHQLFVDTIDDLQEVQFRLNQLYNLDSLSFAEKKELTSAFRRLAPIGIATTMGWSANLRTIRNVIEQRTAPGAEAEIRELFTKVFNIMKEECPAVFEDYDDNMVTENKKV